MLCPDRSTFLPIRIRAETLLVHISLVLLDLLGSLWFMRERSAISVCATHLSQSDLFKGLVSVTTKQSKMLLSQELILHVLPHIQHLQMPLNSRSMRIAKFINRRHGQMPALRWVNIFLSVLTLIHLLPRLLPQLFLIHLP